MIDHKKNFLDPYVHGVAMPINFFSCSELLNEMCPQTTNQGYRKDQMAILGGLKTKYQEFTYQDQKHRVVLHA